MAPLQVEKHYKGVRPEATIVQSGQVVWDGTPYDSLSTAAGMARKSVIGTATERGIPATNGRVFWQRQDGETGRLRHVSELRRQYLEQRA